jgi:fluoroquinolone resistance protein
MTYTADQLFENRDFTTEPFLKGEYVACTFVSCQMTKVNLSGYVFEDCTFVGCDLSMVVMNDTAWRNVTFRDTKILGVSFDVCKNFGLSFMFEGCLLDHSSFCGKKLRNTRFVGCRLHETDFSECDLSSSVFDHCDMTRTVFVHSVLESCDLRSSTAYRIDPDVNRLRGAMFSYPDVLRLLDKYGVVVD